MILMTICFTEQLYPVTCVTNEENSCFSNSALRGNGFFLDCKPVSGFCCLMDRRPDISLNILKANLKGTKISPCSQQQDESKTYDVGLHIYLSIQSRVRVRARVSTRRRRRGRRRNEPEHPRVSPDLQNPANALAPGKPKVLLTRKNSGRWKTP